MLKLLQTGRSILRAGTCGKNCLRAFSVPENVHTPIPSPEELPKYEVCRDEKLWQYVERLLPDKFVPAPPQTSKELPCGWKPQKLDGNLPYVVQRTRNHMLPIYLRIKNRGMKKRTVIKNLYGDVWTLAKDLKNFLQKVRPDRPVGIKLHEASGKIIIHGDHVSDVKLWFERRNF